MRLDSILLALSLTPLALASVSAPQPFAAPMPAPAPPSGSCEGCEATVPVWEVTDTPPCNIDLEVDEPVPLTGEEVSRCTDNQPCTMTHPCKFAWSVTLSYGSGCNDCLSIRKTEGGNPSTTVTPPSNLSWGGDGEAASINCGKDYSLYIECKNSQGQYTELLNAQMNCSKCEWENN